MNKEPWKLCVFLQITETQEYVGEMLMKKDGARLGINIMI